MDGLYIHIPFCESRCIYCDFYSTTRLESINRYVDALCHELALKGRKGIFHFDDPLQTIYIGGGTPSVLSPFHLSKLVTKIDDSFEVDPHSEFTMECNPEDITWEYLDLLSVLPINRLSFGVQTFNNDRLLFLHRRHTSEKAIEAIRLSKETGFKNISIDLMFGFPGETLEEWEKDIDIALSLDVPHISAYSLMYEEGTKLTALFHSGKIHQIDDELSLAMYDLLIDKLKSAGYEHYEISNFAKPGYRSKHNSSYWMSKPYIGIGAGAHSYDGDIRSWNISDLDTYMSNIESDVIPEEQEVLTIDEKYNEYVMTRLRTCEGVCLEDLSNRFGSEYLDYFNRISETYLASGKLTSKSGWVRLSGKGIYQSDGIMSSFFHVQ